MPDLALPPHERAPANSRRGSFWTAVMVLAFAVSGIAVLAVVVDWAGRTHAMSSLMSEVEASEAVMASINEEAAGIAGSASIGPQDGPRLAPQLPAGSLDQLQTLAEQSVPALTEAGAGLDDIWVLPWQSDVAAARNAYKSHHLAWVRYLEAAKQDPSAFFRDFTDIGLTWELAEDAVRQAAPQPALPVLTRRIDTVFSPESSGEEVSITARAG